MELQLFRLMAKHTQQDNFHLRGLQLCTHTLVVTGFSTCAHDPEDLLSSHTGGAQATILDTGTENLLVPDKCPWGVCAAHLSK